jgi:hypothetical protein
MAEALTQTSYLFLLDFVLQFLADLLNKLVKRSEFKINLSQVLGGCVKFCEFLLFLLFYLALVFD